MRSVDDRNKPVRLERLPHNLLRRTVPPILKYTTIQIQRMERTEVPTLIAPFLVMVGVIFLLATFMGVVNLNVVRTLAPFLFIGALIASIWWSVRRIDRVHAIHYLPAQGTCAACGHSLRGLAPEADACTVCPECGAAWRIPPKPKIESHNV